MKNSELMAALEKHGPGLEVRAVIFDGATKDVEEIADVTGYDGQVQININVLSPDVSLVPDQAEERTPHRLKLTETAESELAKLDEKYIGTPDYMGFAKFWHASYSCRLDDADCRVRQYVHDALLVKKLDAGEESAAHEQLINTVMEKCGK